MLLTHYLTPRCENGQGSLRRFQNDVEQLFGVQPATDRVWLPSLEVVETPDQFVVALELPGIKAEDVKVTLEEGVLNISGERKYTGAANAELRLSERFYGKFERSVRLASPVQSDRVTATSKDGVLTIALPKTEEARPREIKIAAS